jgi:hypothetical protein
MTFAPDWSDHFWSRCCPEALSGCWLWHGEVNDRGYGRYTIKGQRYQAHRVAYERALGAIPDGMFVCHRCDVPGCVNPSHLFLGTHLDNMADRTAKGREARGARHPLTKLTTEQVEWARAEVASGKSRSAVARELGVSLTATSLAVRGRTWSYLGAPAITSERRWGVRDGARALSDDEVADVRHRAASGESYASISRQTGIAKTTVRRVATGERYKTAPACEPDVASPLPTPTQAGAAPRARRKPGPNHPFNQRARAAIANRPDPSLRGKDGYPR